jgi:hypothetical protein
MRTMLEISAVASNVTGEALDSRSILSGAFGSAEQALPGYKSHTLVQFRRPLAEGPCSLPLTF